MQSPMVVTSLSLMENYPNIEAQKSKTKHKT